jgi:plasmid stability protein
MEEEARDILRQVVGEGKPAHNLAASIRARVAPLGGADLDLPLREPMRMSFLNSCAQTPNPRSRHGCAHRTGSASI